MKHIIFIFFISLSYSQIAQEVHKDYTITDQISLTCTPVISQGKTGTCWSFSTTSYLESEVARMGHGIHDLSELYQVRNTYTDKAQNYILRQGTAQFGQGALSHDVINSVKKHGIVPNAAYTGLTDTSISNHDHRELIKMLKNMVTNAVENKILSDKWNQSYQAILDIYLVKNPESFEYQGKQYTPQEFAAYLGIDPQQYITLTSFTHQPAYDRFILEIPDNFSNGIYHNVALDELEKTVDYALENGFTVTWDGDVSEIGFSQDQGLAILTSEINKNDAFKNYTKEEKVTPASRQQNFENYNTTDDHLMHIVGKGIDKKGVTYYKIKNSWGEKGPYNGYLYMSLPYFRMKTVGILLHKDGIPKNIVEKLSL